MNKQRFIPRIRNIISKRPKNSETKQRPKVFVNEAILATLSIFILAFLITGSFVVNSRAQSLTSEEWDHLMALNPATSIGCFEAFYPNVLWVPAICSSNPTPIENLGNGNDFVGVCCASGPTIGAAWGYFGSITGLTSESDNRSGSNYYSIQANSELFSVTLGGHLGSAWQQFVFANHGSSYGQVYMQYWLISWYSQFGSCPAQISGLTSWSTYGKAPYISCWADSANITQTPAVLATQMVHWYLYGYANYYGVDEAQFCGPTKCYASTAPYTAFNLAASFTQVEWNVLGYGSGSIAQFNSGTHIAPEVNLYTHNLGTSITPTSCPYGGAHSAEQNNLNQGTCNVQTGDYVFSESR